MINSAIKGQWPNVSIPLFAMSFVVGLLGRFLLKLAGRPNYLDGATINSISGAATDFMIAFGIASIVPAALAGYWQALVVMFVLGTIFCVVWMFWAGPTFFGDKWLERGLFGWGWATAAAVGSALEEIGVDGASSLGFTSATVGTIVAIVGGVIMANWGIRNGKASQLAGDLPQDLRTGYIQNEDERPSIGKATTNPSSICLLYTSPSPRD